MALAERGVPWAQTNVGEGMIRGNKGFKKQEKAGLKWIKKAAAQNYPSALYYLSGLYRDGLTSVQDKSQEKANELLLKSANLGCASANSMLAGAHFRGLNGFEKDADEAYFRASVAYAINDSDKKAAKTLGILHYYEEIPEPSFYLACYYLNHVAANEDHEGMYSYLYCQSLQTLNKHLHNGPLSIPGFDVVPALLFWMRRSCDLERHSCFGSTKEMGECWAKVLCQLLKGGEDWREIQAMFQVQGPVVLQQGMPGRGVESRSQEGLQTRHNIEV